MKRFLLILYLCCFVSQAWSDELFEMYRPTRAMGMGGVLTIFPKETDAVMLNPAFLRWNSGLSWEIINVQIGADQNGADLYQKIRTGVDFSIPSNYNQLMGKPMWMNAAGKIAVALPYIGFGIFSGVQINAQLNNPAYPAFNMNYLSDTVTALGFAIPVGLFSSVGMTAKRIARWGGNQDVSLGLVASGSTSTILDQFDRKGTGYGMDLAWTSKIDIPFQPAVTLVWQDVGSTQFNVTSGTSAPPRIKDNLALGIGSKLDLPGLDITTGFEYRHMTTGGESLGKKLHFGTEISLPLIDVRAGMNQGYGAYGAAIDFWFMRLDGALWTEELGEYPGQLPQQRYEISLSLQFSFDANFSMMDSSGRKRKLKQRR